MATTEGHSKSDFHLVWRCVASGNLLFVFTSAIMLIYTGHTRAITWDSVCNILYWCPYQAVFIFLTAIMETDVCACVYMYCF